MKDLTKETLLETVEETVERASELGDHWTGTTLGRVLDSERDNVLKLVRNEDLELASVSVLNLAMTCQFAEEKLREEGEI